MNLVRPAARAAVHLAAVGSLAAVVVLHAGASRTDAAAAVLIPLAVVGGGAFAIAYHRARPLRSILTLLSPAPVVFLLLFLFNGQVAKLVLPGDSADATAVAVQAKTPVVIVIFDELPVMSLMDAGEEIDTIRYPSFGALAADSLWFRNTTAVGDYTSYAAPPILSGVYPKGTQLPIAADYPRNVFTLLGRSYDIEAVMPFQQLCPSDVCARHGAGTAERAESLLSDVSVVYGHLVLPADMRERLPPIEGTWGDFRGGGETAESPRRKVTDTKGRPGLHRALSEALDTRSEGVEDFLASLTSSRTPTLHLLHTIFPHRPFDRMPSGKYYGPEPQMEGIDGTTWGDNEFLVRQGWQRHLLQTEFSDRVLGEIVRRLKRIGTYDRALIVVTADHGASFWPGHSFRRMDETTLPDIALVPLFVKLPHGEDAGTVVDRHVQTVDVLPTITDVLDVDPGWQFDGRSLLDGGTDRVYIVAKDGTTRTARMPELLAGRREHVRRQVEIFGTGRDQPGLFGIGPNRELVGRSADDFPPAAPGGVTAVFDRPNDFRSVAPDDAYVPTWITGTIGAVSSARPLELAVSVNGRVAAVGESFRRPGEDRDRFAFVVPESAFRPGANDVRLFWVQKTSGDFSLARISPD